MKTLSENIVHVPVPGLKEGFIPTEKVKEFMKELKTAIGTLEEINIPWAVDIQRLIDKLAGKDLI